MSIEHKIDWDETTVCILTIPEEMGLTDKYIEEILDQLKTKPQSIILKAPIKVHFEKKDRTIFILQSILNSMLTCNHIKRVPGTPTQNGYHRGHENRKKIDIGFVEWQIEKVMEELKKE